MPDVCFLPCALIPLSSTEPLWEWDAVTDSLFLTQGAVKALRLEKRPRDMGEFYALMPPDAAAELAVAREGIISGKSGSAANCGYMCNGLWIQEHALVLARNSEGRATRLLGQLAVSTVQRHMGFRGGEKLLGNVGVWLFDPRQRLVWRDHVCEEILGKKNVSYPVAIGDALFDVHPAERAALKRHYDLFISGNFLGDTITDVTRLRLADGEYARSFLRATAMQRDSEGRALFISGILAPGESARQPARPHDERLFDALNSMGDGRWNWDTRQDMIYFGPRYLALLGYPPDEDGAFSRQWRSYVHPDDLPKLEAARNEIIAGPEHGDFYEATFRMRRADGGWAWIFDRGCVTWRDTDGRAGHLIGSITNITTAQAERDRLEELVRHDTLTGLRSRAFCNLEIEHIEQNGIRPVSIISVDITGLKMINDYLGHARGDELLIQAATLMRSILRRSDCIGRIGGDEFLIILPGCDYDKGEKVLDKLKAGFKDYNLTNPQLPVFAAAGLACSETMQQSIAETMEQADEEMYRDKKNQRQYAHERLKEIIRQQTGKTVGADERISD